MKKYVNALQILPEELVKELQKHVSGKYVYVPRINRQQWGEQSGIRDELKNRNEEIHRRYLEGIPVHELATIYNLSQERIRGIIYSKESK